MRRVFDEVLSKGSVDVTNETNAEEAFTSGSGAPVELEANEALALRVTQVFDDVEVSIDEMIAEDDLVMGRCRVQATYAGGLEDAPEETVGTRVAWDGLFQFRVRDGRIVENLLAAQSARLRAEHGDRPTGPIALGHCPGLAGGAA